MTATNHALTGAFIGSVVNQPVLAIILALTSHLVLDSLPHYAEKAHKITGKRFDLTLAADILLCFAIALTIFIYHPVNTWLVLACAFVATSPDFLWLPNYVATKRKRPLPFPGIIRKFLSRIQWSETPSGSVVEILWLISFTAILLLRHVL